MPLLERVTKTATILSILLILGLELTVHPDLTWGLSLTAFVALIASWLAAPKAGNALAAGWILAASLAPLAVRAITLREGTVADLVWMAGLAGVLTRTSWSRWSLPPAWSALAGSWALTLALAWPVLLLREIPFGAPPANWSDISAAVMLAPQVVRWTLYVVFVQLVGVLWLDWIAQHADDHAHLPRLADAFWLGATISSMVAIYQGTIGTGFGSAERWILERRATGTMLDGNALGSCAALAGPVAFVLLRGRTGWMRLLAPVVLAINVAGLWMSGSMTGLLCGIAGLAGLVMARSASRDALRRPAMATIAASLIVVALLTVTASAVGPVRRLLGLLDSPGAVVTTLWHRGGYGTVAMRMIREYPLTGVGIGSYRALASDYNEWINHLPLAPDNAQNWWRHEVAELGILGSLPVLALSAAILWLVLVPEAKPERRGSVTIARSLIVGLGLSSLLGLPTQNAVVMLWFLLLVAWVIASTQGTAAWLGTRPARVMWIAGALLALAYAAGHAVLARESLAPMARAARWHHPYIAGAYPPEPAEGSGEFRWTRDTAHFVWPAETRWVVLQVWANHPDIARAPVEVTFSDRCGVFFNEAFRTPDPVRVGFQLRDGDEAMDLVTRVSRTWRPAAFGDADPRTLGIGVKIQFAASESEARSVGRWAPLPSCPAATASNVR